MVTASLVLGLLLQNLVCSPHPPAVGATAQIRFADGAGRAIVGVEVQVESRLLGMTDGRGEVAWVPERAGLHVLTAWGLVPGQEEPVRVLLAVDVPAGRGGVWWRVVLGGVALGLLGWNLVGLRRGGFARSRSQTSERR
jgi:hypothetical protein